MKLRTLIENLYLENIDGVLHTLSKIDSYEDFEKYIKSQPDQIKRSILNYVEQENSQGNCKHGTPLYHGTDSKVAIEILNNGFKLGKGRRSGFMGSEYVVDNLGIFLTDSKKAASFFGTNRSERGNTVVLKVCTDLGSILDLSNPQKIPPIIKKLGLELLNDYAGTSKSKIAGKDIWWLLDKSIFVDKIKEFNFNSVKFKEASDVVRMIKDQNAYTYMVFDPNRMIVNKRINTLQDLYTFLRS